MWTVGYALFWGGLTVSIPFFNIDEYGSVAIALATSILGAVVVSLAICLYYSSQRAAWGLVIFAIFDIISRIVQQHSGYLMPLILLGLAVRSANYLRAVMRCPNLTCKKLIQANRVRPRQPDHVDYTCECGQPAEWHWQTRTARRDIWQYDDTAKPCPGQDTSNYWCNYWNKDALFPLKG